MFFLSGLQRLFFLMLEWLASLPSSRQETPSVTGMPLIWRERRVGSPLGGHWYHSQFAGSCPDLGVGWGMEWVSLLASCRCPACTVDTTATVVSPELTQRKSWVVGPSVSWVDSSRSRPCCWERLKAKGEGGSRGWDGWMASLTRLAWGSRGWEGWMASLTRLAWVWASSERFWGWRSSAGVHGLSRSQTKDLATRQQSNKCVSIWGLLGAKVLSSHCETTVRAEMFPWQILRAKFTFLVKAEKHLSSSF